MPVFRTLLLVLLLAACPLARADYLIRTFNGVIRYSDTGERLIEYGRTGGDVGSGYWLGESVDALAFSSEGYVFCSTNNLGSRSLLQFDLETGLNVRSEPSVWGEPEVWVSDFVEPEMQCGIEGCSRVSTSSYATARLRDGLLYHPDGHLYALGVSDLFSSPQPSTGAYTGSHAALIRFSADQQGPPSVVSLLPFELLGDDFSESAVVSYGDLGLGPDGLVYVAGEIADTGGAMVSVDPTELGAGPNPTAVDPDVVAINPGFISQGYVDSGGFAVDENGVVYLSKMTRSENEYGYIIEKLLPGESDFEPFIEIGPYPSSASESTSMGDLFLDDRGRLLVPMTRQEVTVGTALPTGYLLEYDASNGQFLRTVFEVELDVFESYEYYFGGGLYISTVPEPTTQALTLAALLAFGCFRRRAFSAAAQT